MIDFEKAVSNFVQVAQLADIEMRQDEIEVEVLRRPHRPRGLPSGRMAIYSFIWNDKVLKIGKAGPNSDARYRSQHYNGCANSTLAGSLIEHGHKLGIGSLSQQNVKQWICDQTDRVNLLLPATTSDSAILLLETYLHVLWRPLFEGKRKGD